MSEPAFSIIMPLYNCERYVVEAVKSIKEQTFQGWELIIVNDGSTDNSVEVLQPLVNSDNRIKLLSNNRSKGVSGARNTGIMSANGKYCAFIDADDCWYSHKLEQVLTFLKEHPKVGFTFDCSEFIDEEGNSLGVYQIPKMFEDFTPEIMLLRNPIGCGSSPVIRTEAIQVVLFDETLHHCEDLECWVRFFLTQELLIQGIPQVLTKYRVRRGNASSNLSNQLVSMKQVLLKLRMYSPSLVNNWGSLALAYQLRFLARRSVKDQKPLEAIHYINTSLVTDIRVLLQEPSRTLTTLVAAYLMGVIPNTLFKFVLNFLMQKLGYYQRKLLTK